ncbi:MAG: hypothetical protein V4436_00125 [Patescibacteria group bacterium]
MSIRYIKSVSPDTQRDIVKAVHKMLAVLDPSDVDDIDVTLAAMSGVEVDGTPSETIYRMHVVMDDNVAIAVQMCGVRRIAGTNLAVNMNAYVAKLPRYNGRILLKLNELALEQAQDDAKAKGYILFASSAEASTQIMPMAERRGGFVRLFIKQADGSYVEWKYLQPQLRYYKNGKPFRGEQPSAHHFMIALHSGPDVTLIAGLIAFGIAEAVIDWSHRPPEHYFKNRLAYKLQRAHIQGFLDDLKAQLDSGQPEFLTLDHIDYLRKQGVVVSEYTEADGE